MTQLSHPVDPFGEVNVFRSNGGLSVKAMILMVPSVENARTAMALDASASMQPSYGVKIGPFPAAKPNVVEPVARTLSAFLANFSSDARCTNIYWACNADGSAIEEIGKHTADEVQSVEFRGPAHHPWGKQTRLLPPVRYFAEQAFRDSPWSIGVIVTDGRIDDLDEVLQYSHQLGRQMATGQRQFLKLVLIGVGNQIEKSEMEQLDDMFEDSDLRTPRGGKIDLWDHKVADDMQKVEQIFSEIPDEDTIVVESGRILDHQGRVVREYRSGVPAVLHFDLPDGATQFTLQFPGGKITQDISEVYRHLS